MPPIRLSSSLQPYPSSRMPRTLSAPCSSGGTAAGPPPGHRSNSAASALRVSQSLSLQPLLLPVQAQCLQRSHRHRHQPLGDRRRRVHHLVEGSGRCNRLCCCSPLSSFISGTTTTVAAGVREGAADCLPGASAAGAAEIWAAAPSSSRTRSWQSQQRRWPPRLPRHRHHHPRH